MGGGGASFRVVYISELRGVLYHHQGVEWFQGGYSGVKGVGNIAKLKGKEPPPFLRLNQGP